MTDSSNPTGESHERAAANVAYTIEAVNQYLDDVAARREDLERAIAEARGRTARAELAMTRLNALERSVGASLVAAYAKQVSVARHLGKARPLYDSPAASVIDLRPAEPTLDDEEDGLARLGGELPEGFGDEFFGPLSSVRINGSRAVAEARHG